MQNRESDELSTFKQYRIHSHDWFDHFIDNVKNNSYDCLNNYEISCLIGVWIRPSHWAKIQWI